MIIKFLCLFIDKIYFLGLGELNNAKKIHNNNLTKLIFSFHIDTVFWSDNSQVQANNILFVGNDGNRDPEKFISAVKDLKNEKFVAVSNLDNFKNINEDNFTLYSNETFGRKLTDTELKKIYTESKLVVIPLKESYQPSGQSVALQAMSMGVPVLITETKGFWDPYNFKDNKNIFFVTKSSNDEFTKKIIELISDKELLEAVALREMRPLKNIYQLKD